MTQLELLAAKVRGANNNADAAEIIADWYDNQVKHSINNSNESAQILRADAAKFDTVYGDFLAQIATNFETSAKLLEFSRSE